MWSGRPNGRLVAEVADLPPGRALDVGSGEGADAIWLARRGWTVTAVEISDVARLWDVHEVPDAEQEIALTVLRSSGELSAADLGGALGWRVKRSREVLEQLDLRTRREGDVTLYSLV
mgnify:CR=1 FL=1